MKSSKELTLPSYLNYLVVKAVSQTNNFMITLVIHSNTRG